MNPKTRKRLIIAAVVMVVLVFLVIQSCTIRTPEIHGVVLDAETNEPVAEAWIKASISTKSLTIQGDVGGVISLAPPHLRTAEDGTFVIPARKFSKTPFPLSFGTTVGDMSVSARTLDKSGRMRSDKAIGFWNRKMDVTINLEDEGKLFREEYPNVTRERLEELREGSEFAGLQGLYRYCRSGRAGIEVAIEKSKGCDDWELDFTIAKHERYLGRFNKIIEERGYSTVLDQLSRLYEQKGNYEKAINPLRKRIELMEKKGLLEHTVWQRRKADIEKKIGELQTMQTEREDK
jgi:hypothetical protein